MASFKVTGAEYKAFFNDSSMWDNDSGNIWIEEDFYIISSNGENIEIEDLDIGSIKDTDILNVLSGVVLFADSIESVSLSTYFKRWKKKSSRAYLSVECDAKDVELIKALLKEHGAKVK